MIYHKNNLYQHKKSCRKSIIKGHKVRCYIDIRLKSHITLILNQQRLQIFQDLFQLQNKSRMIYPQIKVNLLFKPMIPSFFWVPKTMITFYLTFFLDKFFQEVKAIKTCVGKVRPTARFLDSFQAQNSSF